MTKHEYICAICDVVRSKSDCYKRQVGAVFINKDYEILATGYNGPPSGFAHCDKVGDMTGKISDEGTCGNPCMRNIHAEMNAILQAAKRGTALRGSILYCTYLPCVDCARALVNVGVASVLAEIDNDDGGWKILADAKIAFNSWSMYERH